MDSRHVGALRAAGDEVTPRDKKQCTRCLGKPKLLSEFHKNRKYADGRAHACKVCVNAAQRVRDAQARGDEDPVNPPPPRPVAEVVTPVEEHRLRRRNAELEGRVKSLLEDLNRFETLRELEEVAARSRRDVESISPREKACSGKREACGMALASDWHVEEEVRPEQVAGRNTYNLDIAARRMTRYFEAARYAMDFNRQAFIMRDMMLWLGGDFITNFLHPDNRETNLLGPPQALAFALENLSAGIKFLLEDPLLERLTIPCNDGNHGRISDKMRSAARIANSAEWLLYTVLAREFANEPRVRFVIAEGAHLYHEVYGRTIRFTHGDTVRYQGGVGGLTIPLYKALANWNTVRRADLTVLGHFHQRTTLEDIIVNGSLIGYSPYSLDIKARFEHPVQDFTVLDSRRWKSVSMPLWVSDAD